MHSLSYLVLALTLQTPNVTQTAYAPAPAAATSASNGASWYVLSNAPGWKGYGKLNQNGWLIPEKFQNIATGEIQIASDKNNTATPSSHPQQVQQATQVQAAPAQPAGDAYGFLNWLNATRASYGLPAVGYDPNLESWAAMNSAQQAASGIGHFIMGPARRQNAAMGGYPGIESMWMASPAHRDALLDPTIQWIGIAAYGAYWTFNAY